MRHLSILLGLIIAGAPMAMAQWEDDIYYNPNKKEKKTAVKVDNLTTGVETGRTDITVDQYNMRGFGGTNALAIDTIGAQVASEPDFVYTGQIQKYYNPTIVVDNADVLADVINNSYGNVNVVINSGVPVFDVYSYNWPSYWLPSYGNAWYSSMWPVYWTPTYGYGWGAYTWAYNPVFGGYGFSTYNPYWWMWSPVYDYWSPSHPRHYTYGTYNPHGNKTYRLPQVDGRNSINRHAASYSGYRSNSALHETTINAGGGRPSTGGYRTNANIRRTETQATWSGHNNGGNNRVEHNGYNGLNGWGNNTSGAHNNSYTNRNMHGNMYMGTHNNGGSRSNSSIGSGNTMHNGGARSSMGGASTRGTASGGARVGGGSGSVRR